MLPILQVGPFALQTPGLILIIGLWIGLSVAERFADRFGIPSERIYNLTFIMLIAGIVGARLSVAVQFPAAFIENPISLVSLNPALLDPAGGLGIAMIAGLIYINRNGLMITSALDALTPALGILAIALSLSNLAAGTAFGSPTDMPWGILLWEEVRHPTQIYQAGFQALILWFVWPGRKHAKQPSGTLFLIWLALSAGARILVEAFRADSLLLPNGVRQAQIIAWAVLAASLLMLYKFKTRETAIK